MTMPTRYPREHFWRSDGIEDFFGRPRCPLCGLPQDHAVHDVPAPTDEQSEHDRRVIGERECLTSA